MATQTGFRRIVASSVIALVCAAATPIPAFAGAAWQPADEAAADLPAAAEIFERHIEAIGGQDAIDALQNRRITGTYSGVPFDYTARLQVWWERDGRYHQKVIEPGGLRYQLYANNGRTWMQIMDNEPAPILGSRHVEMMDTSDFLGEANYAERYKSMKTAAKAKADGMDVWVVQAITQLGRPHTLFFSVESGILQGTRVPVTSENGIREMTVKLYDYVDAGGVLYPSRIVQQFAGDTAKNEFRYTKIEVNAEDEHDYSVPAEIEQVFVELEQQAESGEAPAPASDG